MLLSLLLLGVSLVVLGMWRTILIDAWRTRPLSEGGESPSSDPAGSYTGLPLSESDCGYESVLPDRIVTRHGHVVSLADHEDALL